MLSNEDISECIVSCLDLPSLRALSAAESDELLTYVDAGVNRARGQLSPRDALVSRTAAAESTYEAARTGPIHIGLSINYAPN